jgi:hypothetical protein
MFFLLRIKNLHKKDKIWYNSSIENDKREKKMMEVDHIGVHRTHCCVLHGCKYGDKDCPVANEVIKQDYLCEDCLPYFNPEVKHEVNVSETEYISIEDRSKSYYVTEQEMKLGDLVVFHKVINEVRTGEIVKRVVSFAEKMPAIVGNATIVSLLDGYSDFGQY